MGCAVGKVAAAVLVPDTTVPDRESADTAKLGESGDQVLSALSDEERKAVTDLVMANPHTERMDGWDEIFET